MPTSPERRVQARLERCAADIAANVDMLDTLYAERAALYVEGVALGVTQAQLAVWAGSQPAAVAKVLRKLRDTTGAR